MTEQTPNPRSRELSWREQVVLATFGTADRQDVEKLIRLKDDSSIISSALDSSKVFTLSLWKGRQSPDMRTTPAVLDHLLSGADPKVAAQLASYGIQVAAKERDQDTNWLGPYIRSGRDSYKTWNDISDKLLVLGHKGGDLNLAIDLADNKELLYRNAKLTLAAGQTFTTSSAQKIATYLGDKLQEDHRLLAGTAAAGVYPDGPALFITKGIRRTLEINDRLSIALLVDPTYKLFETERARGSKTDTATLLYHTGKVNITEQGHPQYGHNQTHVPNTLAYLNQQGFDINAKDAEGRTALTRITQDMRKEIATDSDDARTIFYYGDPIISMFKAAGASGNIKDNTGMSADDYRMGAYTDLIAAETQKLNKIHEASKAYKPELSPKLQEFAPKF